MEIIRGKIAVLWGLPGSNLAHLNLILEDRTMVSIPCDNAPTVRALDDAFGTVIGENHSVNPDGGHIDQEIVAQVGNDGILEGFIPVEMAVEDMMNGTWNIDASKLN